MSSKNHPIILFLDRNGFSIFQDTLSNVARFNFTPDIVANLDVVNKEQFGRLIATFIQINKIVPSSLSLVLSDNIIYEKDMVDIVEKQTPPVQTVSLEAPGNIDKEHKEEIQAFLEDVPFEEVLAKVIKTDKLNRIAAVNKDLVMTIADVFVNKGSTIEAVIPSFMYGTNINFAAGLTQNNIQIILEGSEVLRTGNLLTNQQRITSPQGLEIEQKEKEKKPQNLSLYILIGVFVTLVIILAVVYLNMGASQTHPASKKIKSAVDNSVAIPTTAPSVQIQASAIPTDLKVIRVKIVQSTQASEIFNSLSQQLQAIGFQDIKSSVSETSPAEKSSVVFSKNVPADAREKAFIEIKKVLPSISISENQDFDQTITVLIGRT
ncbi:MAG: hypothetical protein HYW62_03280 [Candidatus Levybacteria bacterium]|nr:hypothetical protein [Candidatus Levybacteria bacterium]